jgi:hypothetical protein
MIQHLVLYKLNPDCPPETVENMMRSTRMSLLKIQEVRSVRCGKRIEDTCEWPFFVAVEYESLDQMAAAHEDPIYIKYVGEIVNPNVADRLTLDFEMDPGKDVRYS